MARSSKEYNKEMRKLHQGKTGSPPALANTKNEQTPGLVYRKWKIKF